MISDDVRTYKALALCDRPCLSLSADSHRKASGKRLKRSSPRRSRVEAKIVD